MIRLPFFAALIAGVLLSAGSAKAAPAHARLEYQCQAASEDCPTAQELEDAVAVRLGYSPFDQPNQQPSSASEADAGEAAGAQLVQVQVDRAAGVWTAKLQLFDSEGALLGERVLTDPGGSRHGFAESIALAISLALDPLGNGRPPAVAPEPPAPKPTTPVAVVGSLGLVGAVGAAPSPNLGLDLEVEVRRGNLSLGLAGREDFPASSGSITTSVIVGELIPCYRWDRFAGCLLAVAGVQSASSNTGDPSATQGSAPFGAAGARASADFSLGRPFALQVGLETWAPLTRTQVLVGAPPGQVAWTTYPIEGALTLALLYSIR